jgi:nucleotide-binding universal stress UspA family protein
MWKKILVPTDGSKASERALEHGARLARALGASIVAYHAQIPYPVFFFTEAAVEDDEDLARHRDDAARFAEHCLHAAATVVRGAGVPCATIHTEENSPAEGILEAAKRNECDLILMASRGPKGVAQLLLGSETAKVLAHADRSVLVVP